LSIEKYGNLLVSVIYLKHFVCGSLGHATGWLFLTGRPDCKTSDLLNETDPFPETLYLKEAKKLDNVYIIHMSAVSAAT
jgi:hypothetical protein